MRNKLLMISAALAVAGALVVVAIFVPNSDARVPEPPATTEMTEAPASTTASGDCGLLATVTITASNAYTSYAPGEPERGIPLMQGEEMKCVGLVDGFDDCWIQVEIPEWTRDGYDPGVPQFLDLALTNSERAMPGGPCFNAETY